MVDDAAASRALEEAVRHAGFAPIARTTAAEVIKHLCRAPEASVVAAFVSSELPERGQQHAFTYLAEQWPSARRIVVERGVSSLDVAAALHGAGRYG
jgi:hypothetical protein